MASKRGRLSEAQRRTLEALAEDGAYLMVDDTSRMFVVDGHGVTMCRVATQVAIRLCNRTYIDHEALDVRVYHITDAGREALAEAEGKKESEAK
jgi:hypothetical protein